MGFERLVSTLASKFFNFTMKLGSTADHIGRSLHTLGGITIAPLSAAQPKEGLFSVKR